MKNHLISHGNIYSFESQQTEAASLLLTEGNGADTRILRDASAPDHAQPHDATDCLVIPGLVDLCAHLREPGYKQKGTIESETHAALRGGITTLCCHPTTRPVNDQESITRLILEQVASTSAVRVLPIGALTQGNEGTQLSEIASLQAAGCIAVLHARGTPIDTQTLYRCFQYAASHGMTVFFEPEDSSFSSSCLHEGALSCRLGLVGQPALAETAALARVLLIAEETGTTLHISQISSARSVELIAAAKSRGIPVTADVAIHSLLLTEGDILDFDTAYHTRPPFRTESDRTALIDAVNSGIVDAIVSQHQPHDSTAKAAPFAESEPGISSAETLLSLGLLLVNRGELTLSAFVNATSQNPARIAGLTKLPDFALWSDVTVVDTAQVWQVSEASLLSKGKNTPFIGQSLPGVVRHVFRSGAPVYTLS